jgi:hypothetical protein
MSIEKKRSICSQFAKTQQHLKLFLKLQQLLAITKTGHYLQGEDQVFLTNEPDSSLNNTCINDIECHLVVILRLRLQLRPSLHQYELDLLTCSGYNSDINCPRQWSEDPGFSRKAWSIINRKYFNHFLYSYGLSSVLYLHVVTSIGERVRFHIKWATGQFRQYYKIQLFYWILILH